MHLARCVFPRCARDPNIRCALTSTRRSAPRLGRVLLSLAAIGQLALSGAFRQAHAQATGTLVVVVTDSATSAPVPNADVAAAGRHARTDANGTTRLPGLPAGDVSLTVSRIGYVSRTLGTTVTEGYSRAAVRLTADAVAVAGVEARTTGAVPRTAHSAMLREFYNRKEHFGTGYFVDRAQIDRRRYQRPSDAFRGIPNLQLIRGAAGTSVRIERAMTTSGSVVGGGGGTQGGLFPEMPDKPVDCEPLYFLDGVPFYPTNLDVDLRMAEIEGIEVYTSTRVPAQFGGSRAGCGVIVFWTRDQAGTTLPAAQDTTRH